MSCREELRAKRRFSRGGISCQEEVLARRRFLPGGDSCQEEILARRRFLARRCSWPGDASPEFLTSESLAVAVS